MATRTLSLARLARAHAQTPSSLLSAKQTTTAVTLQCQRRTLTTTSKTPLDTSRAILSSWSSLPAAHFKPVRPLGLTQAKSTGRTTPAGGFVIFRPYHVTLRTLDQHQRPPGSNNIKDDHDHSQCDHDHSQCNHDHKPTRIDDDIQPQQKNPIPPNTEPKARMLIGFTCTVCNHRSHKTMSKHAYNHGVVIMQCDHCKNRHLIADHLGWFKNGGVTVEDLVKEKGEEVRKLTREYRLVKDGEVVPSSAAEATGSGSLAEGAVGGGKEKTELELALEKASEGMLEWIPKEILEQEEERMKKSQEAVDHTKKA
ncbi:Threonine synthase-like 1 [Linnemannia zychae]|nr:Threonine synthase-like 1 [Linnemannia zychae]